jgi:hypothetical protein
MAEESEPKRATAEGQAAHGRPAWRPLIDHALESASSFLGGRPWVPPNEPPHMCGLCGRPLHLLVQLDIERLPSAAFCERSGLFQLFYCVNCTDWMPFSAGHVARVIPAEGTSPTASGVELPRHPIGGWAQVEDLPTLVEGADRLGLDDLADDDPCLSGHKLGGWPFWVQGVEYPSCPRCSEEMRYVLQLDFEPPLEDLFGDSGCGHVSQCPSHPEVLAFTWACC